MPQIQGIKGEAAFVYCEPLITQEMEYHRLSRRVNKLGLIKRHLQLSTRGVNKLHANLNIVCYIEYRTLSHFVYDRLG